MKYSKCYDDNGFEIWFVKDTWTQCSGNEREDGGKNAYRCQLINRNINPQKDSVFFTYDIEWLQNLTENNIHDLWKQLQDELQEFKEEQFMSNFIRSGWSFCRGFTKKDEKSGLIDLLFDSSKNDIMIEEFRNTKI